MICFVPRLCFQGVLVRVSSFVFLLLFVVSFSHRDDGSFGCLCHDVAYTRAMKSRTITVPGVGFLCTAMLRDDGLGLLKRMLCALFLRVRLQ